MQIDGIYYFYEYLYKFKIVHELGTNKISPKNDV